MEHFTPLESITGGAILAIAALLMQSQGQTLGISGIYAEFAFARAKPWHYAFLLGLIFASSFLFSLEPSLLAQEKELQKTPQTLFLSAGFLIGFGAHLANGCTSGHGICGMGRFSLRSILASLAFLFFGILTATLL